MKIALAIIAFLISAPCFSQEQVCANINEPVFTAATQSSANRLIRLPKDAPNPAYITHLFMWGQINAGPSGAFPSTMSGDASMAIDPSLQYSKAAGYPAVQVNNPVGLNTLGAMELRPTAPQFRVFDYPTPFAFRHGDAIIFAPEIADSANTHLNIIWTICWQSNAARVNACGLPTRLMINPEPDDAPTISGMQFGFVTDASFTNHQVLTSNITLSTALGTPSMLFDGISSYAYIVDGAADIGSSIQDFTWPSDGMSNSDFTIEVEVNTTDASQDTQYRTILNGISPNGGGAATAPVMGILPTGKVWFGNNSSGPIVTGTSNVADGTTHAIAVSRTAGSTRLFVDGALQASVADSTAYHSPQMTIGRYPVNGLGRWHGHMRHLRITSGVGLYQTNYTVPTWPTC